MTGRGGASRGVPTGVTVAAVLGLGVTLAVTRGRGAEAPLGAHARLASHVRVSELPR